MGEMSLFVLAMEMTTSRYRWIVNSCAQRSLQYPIVALIAYLTGSWRMYLIVANLLFAPLLVFYLIFSESPRYVIYHEKLDRAAATLSDIASDRWNNAKTIPVDIEPEQLATISSKKGDPNHCCNPLELFRKWERAKLTITLIAAMTCGSVVYHLFIKNTSETSGNPFLNISIFGLIRLWVPLFIMIMDRKFRKFGRRTCFLLFQAFLLIILGLIEILRFSHADTTLRLRILGLIGASLGASGSWMVVSQFAIEAYPTAIRGTAYGWIQCFEGIGGLITPYILSLDAVWAHLPFSIMLVMVIGTVLSGYLILPETKFGTLSDKINDFAENKSRI